MKNLLKIIVMLLPYLLNYIDDRIRERKRIERQAQRDALHKDPAGALADHFSGVRNDEAANAAEAAETDTGG